MGLKRDVRRVVVDTVRVEALRFLRLWRARYAELRREREDAKK